MPILTGENSDRIKHIGELKKGDLYVKFDIRFPKRILTKYKEQIIAVLKEND